MLTPVICFLSLLLFCTLPSPFLILQVSTLQAQPGFAFLWSFPKLESWSTRPWCFPPSYLTSPSQGFSMLLSELPPFLTVLFLFYLGQSKILPLTSVLSVSLNTLIFFSPKPMCWPSLYKVLWWPSLFLSTFVSQSPCASMFFCSWVLVRISAWRF